MPQEPQTEMESRDAASSQALSQARSFTGNASISIEIRDGLLPRLGDDAVTGWLKCTDKEIIDQSFKVRPFPTCRFDSRRDYWNSIPDLELSSFGKPGRSHESRLRVKVKRLPSALGSNKFGIEAGDLEAHMFKSDNTRVSFDIIGDETEWKYGDPRHGWVSVHGNLETWIEPTSNEAGRGTVDTILEPAYGAHHPSILLEHPEERHTSTGSYPQPRVGKRAGGLLAP